MPYIIAAEALPERVARQNVGTRHDERGARMGRIIKAIILLGLLGFIGLTGYAYLGDMAPEQAPVNEPVVLDAN